MIILFLYILLGFSSNLLAKPFPLQYSMPAIKIVKKIPVKKRDFAFIIPGKLSTYIYKKEEDYYRDYQSSYFAITTKKGGWDCLRHYEILANGCIPYFIDLDKTISESMSFLPKKLILEAMHLEGVSYLKIDHKKFNKKRYYEILHELLEYTKKYLTTKNMAHYILEKIKYQGNGNILFLSKDCSADYMRDLTLIGFKEIFGPRVVDFPKMDHIYTSYSGKMSALYGNGFTYSKIIIDIPTKRDSIEARIKNKEFDLIVYGSVHKECKFHELVKKYYDANSIVYICGEDWSKKHIVCDKTHLQNLFLREFNAYRAS